MDPIPTEMQAYELDGPSVLQRMWRSCSPKRISNFNYLTTGEFSTLLQSILNELWPREDASVSGSHSHMASSLHARGLTCVNKQ